MQNLITRFFGKKIVLTIEETQPDSKEEIVVDIRGVSLKWLNEVVKNDRKMQRSMNRGCLTKKFGPFVKQITKLKKNSMVEYLAETSPEFVKTKAGVFISHAWGYKFKDLLGTLNSIDKHDQDDLFIWLDSLNVNQHKADAQLYPVEFWKTTFLEAIRDIGRTVAVLQPWNDPIPLTRSWCIWEICGSSLHPDTQVESSIVPIEQEAFIESLKNDVFNLVSKISNIDVSKAQAWKPSDQEMILQAAINSKNGIRGVQESIVDPIRNWMTREALKEVDRLRFIVKESNNKENRSEFALMCNLVGLLLQAQGKLDEAEPLLRESLAIIKQIHGDVHPSVATSLNNIGLLLQDQGKYNEA